jgi:Tol biopolymer transport system component
MGEEDRVGELWVADLDGGARRRQPLDFEPYSAVWSPDGRELLVTGVNTAVLLPVAGTGAPRRLALDWSLFQPRFAPDGRWIVGYRIEAESGRDLWRIATDGAAPHEPLLRAPGQQANPDVSPDGRLLAYQSDESGRPEIYVRPYPAGDREWQVSTDGGTSPVWNRRGGELVWISENALWSVAVAGKGDEIAFGAPRRLAVGTALGLELSLGRFFYNRTYDLAPDGSRFLVVQRAQPVRNAVVYVERAASDAGGR